MDEPNELWRRHARQWHRVGPPLRPPAGDVRLMETLVERWWEEVGGRAPRVLLLGVTPEIAAMRWPPSSELLACDRSPAMIAAIWPGDTTRRRVICADWRVLPLAAHSRDLIVGDGALNVLPAASEYAALLEVLRRVLTADGQLIVRLFVSPAERETPDGVLAALEAGEIGSFHVFKWRLAMAVQRDFDAGVGLAEVWRAWQAHAGEARVLARRAGWPLDVVRTLEAYRDAAARFTFPTLVELRRELSRAFEERGCYVPDYELGERCPTLVLTPRATTGEAAV